MLCWWKKEVLPRRRGKWRKGGKKWIRKRADSRRIKRRKRSLRRITALKAVGVMGHRKQQGSI